MEAERDRWADAISHAAFGIAIVDAADDLNSESANALLKVIEERKAAGTASDLDVAQQESVLNNQRAAVPPLRLTLAQNVNTLATLLAEGRSLEELPDAVAIQLNDTHPALAVAELMRLLIDVHGFDWDKAWAIVSRTFGYTNHTLLPEALESWPVDFFERLLPRHLVIIFQINRHVLDEISLAFPGDLERRRRMSLIDEDNGRRVRMAHLAVVASGRVNGVAKLHSHLMTETIFRDFAQLWPERFTNVTNGITVRRWLKQSNPGLSALLTERLGHRWENNLAVLKELEGVQDDADFRARFAAIKADNKRRLVATIRQRSGVEVDERSLFDVQVKRIHEYKRQLLNLLQTVALYNDMRANQTVNWVPVTKIFGGKAAPTYTMAKLIIKLINDVARTVNADERIGGLLKVVFVPNYGVSVAEVIMPGADISEQISTAGTEASGTGNMKFALNGALTIGTWDGANIEMAQHMGEDQMFVFGLRADEVARAQALGHEPRLYLEGNPALRQVVDELLPRLEATPAWAQVKVEQAWARAYAEMFSGLAQDPSEVLSASFDIGHSELVLVKDISFYSTCEHHLVPFHGTAHVGYIPNESGRITGLSKIARVVDLYARRPQVQERMTQTIADLLGRPFRDEGI